MRTAQEIAAARRRITKSRAVHEAGHAVFIWRGGERVYGEDFLDRRAPFEEIIISPHLWAEDDDLPPLILANGHSHAAAGTVVRRRLRITVPMARTVAFGDRVSGRIAKRRELVQRAKIEAEVEIASLLAGPIAEARNRSVAEFHDWHWWGELSDHDPDEDWDVSIAYRIAQEELCRGRQQAGRLMDETVESIKRLIETDVRYGRTIDALANSLLRRHRIDGDSAIRVMRRAWYK